MRRTPNIESGVRCRLTMLSRLPFGFVSNRLKPPLVFPHEIVDLMTTKSEEQPDVVRNVVVQLDIRIEGGVEIDFGDSLSECRPTGMVDHEIAPKLDSTEIGNVDREIAVVESLSAGNESWAVAPDTGPPENALAP